jgi:hypothetical protein
VWVFLEEARGGWGRRQQAFDMLMRGRVPGLNILGTLHSFPSPTKKQNIKAEEVEEFLCCRLKKEILRKSFVSLVRTVH